MRNFTPEELKQMDQNSPGKLYHVTVAKDYFNGLLITFLDGPLEDLTVITESVDD